MRTALDRDVEVCCL